MSELKFACPVCGQHITADSSTSGKQLECPTCFRKLIIPLAGPPAGSKLVVTAAEVGKPREASPVYQPLLTAARASGGNPLATIGIVLVLACALGAGLYFFKDRLFGSQSEGSATSAHEEHSGNRAVAGAKNVYPIPKDFRWTMDLTNTPIPQTAAAGSVRGRGFSCERATLTAGTLTLRQGRTWPQELGVTVVMFANQAEELSGKTVDVWANRPPPVPRVILRWKDDRQQVGTQTYTEGYAMRIVFGDAANGRMAGRLYLCLPDEAKSFVGGVFDAEIRKPPPPKQRAAAPAVPAPAQRPP